MLAAVVRQGPHRPEARLRVTFRRCATAAARQSRTGMTMVLRIDASIGRKAGHRRAPLRRAARRRVLCAPRRHAHRLGRRSCFARAVLAGVPPRRRRSIDRAVCAARWRGAVANNCAQEIGYGTELPGRIAQNVARIPPRAPPHSGYLSYRSHTRPCPTLLTVTVTVQGHLGGNLGGAKLRTYRPNHPFAGAGPRQPSRRLRGLRTPHHGGAPPRTRGRHQLMESRHDASPLSSSTRLTGLHHAAGNSPPRNGRRCTRCRVA